ncbi:glycosyltransferase 87 family protein [Gillisia limnaea]|uniref:Glycosyltransferase RgtA/B/C/D-like domain-containing protein n=1 Tax=Gillisia limnaea (strain DSM 15749 / LMG 21470 / R-8282) TaxID=865937 RepID=H2BT74_GILLR|nr:glycosyltransferase 87 family protein [Gillisia limnaea]EHQ02632.1 hypothetical protein Gilli_1994 [Gillisia limnaea DSM 15749]
MTHSFFPLNKNFFKNFWVSWLLSISIIFLIFLGTVDKGAYLHPDEFVIIDLGKNILNPNVDWSIAWVIEQQKPAILISYIGATIQEIVFEYFGQFGPRIFAILGALAAATALVKYLLLRGVSIRPTFFLGLIFLLDPLIVQAFTIGRIDGWVMFLCISCCWVLRSEINFFASKKSNLNTKFLFAGSLISLAIFTWPSAIFFFPLIGLELSEQISYEWKNEKRIRVILNILFLFMFGAVISIALLVLPFSEQLFSQWSLIKETITYNTHAGSSDINGFNTALENSIELLRVLKFSPFVVLLAIISLIKFKQTYLFVAILAVIILMLITVVYINRVQYLVPYFIIGIGLLYNKDYSKSDPRSLIFSGIYTLLFWSIGLSLIVRSFLAFDGKAERDRGLLDKAAFSMVGYGDHKVYIPHEFYYSGRSLNWKMYKIYEAHNDPLNLETWEKILPNVDFIIVREYSKSFQKSIENAGLVDRGIYHIYEEPPKPFDGITNNEVRIRNLYSIFRKPYGPYRLYARE